jgi:hypothetical protein
MRTSLKICLIVLQIVVYCSSVFSQNTLDSNSVLINGITEDGSLKTFNTNLEDIKISIVKSDNGLPIDYIKLDSTYNIELYSANLTPLFIHYEIELGLDDYGQPTFLHILNHDNIILISEKYLHIDSPLEFPILRLLSIVVYDSEKNLFYSLPVNKKLFEIKILTNQ